MRASSKSSRVIHTRISGVERIDATSRQTSTCWPKAVTTAGPDSTLIPIAVDRIRDVADWLPGAVGFSPLDLKDLLMSYVQPKSER